MLGIVVANVNKLTPCRCKVRNISSNTIYLRLLGLHFGLKLTKAVIVPKIATARYRPSLASAKKPPRRPRRLRVPMKLVTMVADFADEICKTPTKYVTKFMDMPITHILSDSSVAAQKIMEFNVLVALN
jgi:hypothetical protein